MAQPKEFSFRNIGSHAEDLHDGRVVGPGDEIVLTTDDLREDHNERLFTEGILIGLDEQAEKEAKNAATRGRRDVRNQEEDLAPPQTEAQEEGGGE